MKLEAQISLKCLVNWIYIIWDILMPSTVIIYHYWGMKNNYLNKMKEAKMKVRGASGRKKLLIFLLVYVLRWLHVRVWRVLIAVEVRQLSSKGLRLMQVRLCVRVRESVCVCDCSACPWLAAGKQRFRPPQLPHHYCSQGSPATRVHIYTHAHTPRDT